jgi:hypothetical protein
MVLRGMEGGERGRKRRLHDRDLHTGDRDLHVGSRHFVFEHRGHCYNAVAVADLDFRSPFRSIGNSWMRRRCGRI